MTTKKKKAAALIRDALTYLRMPYGNRKHRWVKGAWSEPLDEQGEVIGCCVQGALLKAAGYEPSNTMAFRTDPVVNEAGRLIAEEAYPSGAAKLPVRDRYDRIPGWNDADRRSFKEVEKVMESAIEKVEGDG